MAFTFATEQRNDADGESSVFHMFKERRFRDVDDVTREHTKIERRYAFTSLLDMDKRTAILQSEMDDIAVMKTRAIRDGVFD